LSLVAAFSFSLGNRFQAQQFCEHRWSKVVSLENDWREAYTPKQPSKSSTEIIVQPRYHHSVEGALAADILKSERKKVGRWFSLCGKQTIDYGDG
jgi:hypothetical protein